MASSTDSPGPLTKTVADAALVTKVIAGKDESDATTATRPVDIDEDKLVGLSMKGKKIALPQEYLVGEASGRVLEAVKLFEKAGAKIEKVSLLDAAYTIAVYTIVQRSEVSSNLARYDGIRYGGDRSKFGFEAKNRSLLGAFSLSTGYFDEYYKKAQQVRTKIIDEFDKLFKEYDFYLAPVSPSAALPVGASNQSLMFGELQDVLVEPSSVAGLTGLSVPCGFVGDLPVGMQITGPQFSEQKILQAGYWYQSQTKHHLAKPKL
jgi:aspartyl-tRNA(Asn)/glutamyl-tRNA(Gln) amidotransferase subunit A